MQHGKRSAQWDHTAALIVHMRLCVGDKSAATKSFNPYVATGQVDQRAEFKRLIREERTE